MNVHWCTPSGGGCSRGGISGMVGAATHDVCPCCARLMAGLAQGVGGAVVAYFDLIAI